MTACFVYSRSTTWPPRTWTRSRQPTPVSRRAPGFVCSTSSTPSGTGPRLVCSTSTPGGTRRPLFTTEAGEQVGGNEPYWTSRRVRTVRMTRSAGRLRGRVMTGMVTWRSAMVTWRDRSLRRRTEPAPRPSPGRWSRASASSRWTSPPSRSPMASTRVRSKVQGR